MKALAIAVLSLSILLLFAGCAQKQEPNVQEPVVPPQNETLNNSTQAPSAPCSSGNPVQKDDCFLALAASSQDAQVCRNIYSIDTLNGCYALFAGNSLDICKKITDTAMRGDCLAKNAQAQKSEEICNLIADMDKRTECLGGILGRCMALNVEERALCSALEKKDSGLCDTPACLRAYALNMSDKVACMKIADEKSRLSCEAVVDRSADDCSLASVTPIRDWCVRNASIELDQMYCSGATDGSDYRNSCYLYFAVEKKNSTICTNIGLEWSRDDCYVNYSVQTATIESCPKVVATNNRVGCYYKAAGINRMPSLCNSLQNGAWRTNCYSISITGESGPVPSDCFGVDSPDWKDQCYRASAIKTNSQAYCTAMRPGSAQDECNSLFGV